ncbi:MAG: DUF2244 domain-containing protein [Geminicoccaceae bacterium]
MIRTAYPPTFDAILYPNPPLGRYGFTVLMMAVIAISAPMAIGFMLAGAWPVAGFLGLDVVLLYGAFRWARRQSRRSETIRVQDGEVVVRTVGPDGTVVEKRMPAYWARASVVIGDQGGGHIRLTDGRTQIRLAAFLTRAEQEQLAETLNQALVRARS